MAERVEIRGGELDGSVLDNAATEATLLRLVEAFEKKNGTGSGSKIQDAYNNAIKAGTKVSTSLGDSFNKTKKAADGLSSGLLGFASKGLSTILSGATFAVRSFTDFLTSSFSNYRDIADTGVTFGNNMVEVSKTALGAGMSMADFTEMVKQNSSVLMALGGTASDGAKRLAELRDGIVNSDLGTRFYGLGLTTKDIEGYMGSYLEQVQRLGNVQRRDNTSLTRGVSLYVEELDKVTKLTGIERKRLDEQAKRIAVDPVFNQLRRALNPEQLAKSTANLAMSAELGGSELESAIKEISTGVVQSDLAKELMSTGALTREAALSIAQGTADAAPILQRSFNVLNKSGRYANASLLQANQQLAAGAVLRDRLVKLSDAEFKKAQEEQKKRSELTAAFGKIPAVFDNIRNKIFGAFIKSKFFDQLINTFEKFAKHLNTYIDPIVAYFGKLFEILGETLEKDGLVAAIKKGFTILGTDISKYVLPDFNKTLNNLFGSEDLMTSVGKFIRQGFESLIKVALESIGSVIGGMLGFGNRNAATEGSPAGDAAGGTGGGVATTQSALGDFLPILEKIGTVLGVGAAGTAGLILAFTLFGAAAAKAAPGIALLAGAIGITGAGLGFMFGKLAELTDAVGNTFTKIEQFVENMSNKDPNKVKGIGEALGPLSDALFKMGGSGVLALFGSDGLVNLGTALERIQTLDPTKISSVVKPLTDLHGALKLYIGDGILSSLSKAISSFFSGDQGLGKFVDSFVKFNNISGDNIKNVASGIQDLRSSLGQEFTAQAQAIDTYAGRIENLTTKVMALNQALTQLKNQGGRTFTLDQLATAAGGGAATNALVEEQRKLNTLMIELKPVFEETRDNTKNTADGVSGRRSLTER